MNEWNYRGRGFYVAVEDGILAITYDDEETNVFEFEPCNFDEMVSSIEETDGDPNLMATLLSQLHSDGTIWCN